MSRADWRAQAPQLDARQLVFIDECGSNIALNPRYGWALKGQRATGSVPRNRDKNMTLIVSMGWAGMGESMIIDGAADTAAFEQYVESMLAPHRISQDRLWSWTRFCCHKSEKVRLTTLRQRMPGAVRGLALRLTSPPSRKPSETAQNGSLVEWVLAHAKH